MRGPFSLTTACLHDIGVSLGMILPKKKKGVGVTATQRPNLTRSAFFAHRRAAPKDHPPLVQPVKHKLARIMASFELFCELPFDLIAEVASASKVRVYHIGEFIWKRGDRVTAITLVESGFVKLARRDQAEASKTYGLYGPGDAIGLFAMFAGNKHSVDAVALNEGLRTISIDARKFLKLTERSATLSNNVRDELTRFTESLINTIEVVKGGTVAQRLAVLMIQLLSRHGVDRHDNQARLPFMLTLEQLSEIVDARVETLARVLSQWKREGWLSTTQRGFIFPQVASIYGLIRK